MKVTINRALWHHGQGANGSALEVENGNMCCLGFVCRAFTSKVLRERTDPTEVFDDGSPPADIRFLFAEDGYQMSDVCEAMIHINDCLDLCDASREMALAAIAKVHGLDLEFVG